MKTLSSKTHFLSCNISSDQNLHSFLSVIDQAPKTDSVYKIEENSLLKLKSKINDISNIFLIYDKSTYSLYCHISNLLSDVCREYEINQSKQKYMLYGKKVVYSEDTNKDWYDFPGINKPMLHGFYFPAVKSCEMSFENNKIKTKIQISSHDLVINKPTDLINIKTDEPIDVVEFYIAPMEMLKHNEPGVWCPIL